MLSIQFLHEKIIKKGQQILKRLSLHCFIPGFEDVFTDCEESDGDKERKLHVHEVCNKIVLLSTYYCRVRFVYNISKFKQLR